MTLYQEIDPKYREVVYEFYSMHTVLSPLVLLESKFKDSNTIICNIVVGTDMPNELSRRKYINSMKENTYNEASKRRKSKNTMSLMRKGDIDKFIIWNIASFV